jgi:CMP-N-acetylneuraminic acid synthetase
MKKSNSIAFILARKNSKRFKFKNIKKLGNLMLIEHTILAVMNSKCFNEIIISSDDKKILDLAKKYKKIKFLKRPNRLAGDHTKALDVLLFYCQELSLNENFKYISLFLPTAPFKNPKHIQKGFSMLKSATIDFVISVCKILPPIQFAMIDKGQLIKPYFKNSPLIKNNTRSQNQNITYRPNGSFWLCNIKSLLKYKSLYKGNIKKFEMNSYQSIDIDTKFDFEIAKLIYKKKLFK